MKNKIDFKKMMIGMVGVLLSVNLMGQMGYSPRHQRADKPGQGYFCQSIPNLTAEQEQKISALRTAFLKDMMSYKSDLNIRQAELQKLQTADNPDMNKINAKIDEIGKIKTEMAKKRATHLQQVRALLTDDQKLAFDSMHHRKGFGACMYGDGFHNDSRGHGPNWQPQEK